MQTQEMEYNGDTYEIHCGRNAKGNDELLTSSSAHDVWFHVEGMSSAHVILVNKRNETLRKIPKQVIKRAACICKSSIKASGKVTIIYTQCKNVEKTDVIGMVIPHNVKSIII